MTALGLAVLTAVAMAAGAPWWVTCTLAMPALLFAPGLGWARLLLRIQERLDQTAARRGAPPVAEADRRAPVTGLQLGLDAAWIAMGWTWLGVAAVRELGLRGEEAAWAMLALAATFGAVGSLLGRGGHAAPSPRRELLGGVAVLVAVLLAASWRQADLARPLEAYWWLSGADDEARATLPLAAGQGWAETTVLGWPESGALRLDLPPAQGPVQGTLVATGQAEGSIVLAVRGPLGSEVLALGRRAVVSADVWEEGEEAPLRRYLDRGTAAVLVPVALHAGEALPVTVRGEALYVFPGVEAVWSAHAAGALRYTHYWQMLNQVENLDWARQVLDWRWFTVHQPPGWSPILATTVLFGDGDLPGANVLFLWVLALVGGSSVRLASLSARGAPVPAWLVPAGMVAVHALLMLEPASTVFPDSLYAAAVMGVACAVAGRRPGAFAALGLASLLLRWPGAVAATLLALAWWLVGGRRVGKGLVALWAMVALAAAGGAAVALAGLLPDLLFVLYFETFIEHWHGDYQLASLLPRAPDFYLAWLRYSGGGLLLALLGVVGPATEARRGTRAILLGALAYSLILCTIDHHPTHYFLPLVALTGPAVVAASAAVPWRWLGWALSLVTLAGLWTTLAIGQVF